MAAGDWSVNIHDLTFLAFDELLDLGQIVFFPSSQSGERPPRLPLPSFQEQVVGIQRWILGR